MDEDIELTLFIFYAIIIPIIAIFGFIGNLFSIYIIIRLISFTIVELVK